MICSAHQNPYTPALSTSNRSGRFSFNATLGHDLHRRLSIADDVKCQSDLCPESDQCCAVGDLDELSFDADGSLPIYVQHESLSKD